MATTLVLAIRIIWTLDMRDNWVYFLRFLLRMNVGNGSYRLLPSASFMFFLCEWYIWRILLAMDNHWLPRWNDHWQYSRDLWTVFFLCVCMKSYLLVYSEVQCLLLSLFLDLGWEEKKRSLSWYNWRGFICIGCFFVWRDITLQLYGSLALLIQGVRSFVPTRGIISSIRSLLPYAWNILVIDRSTLFSIIRFRIKSSCN